jgi:hypothetical protein
MNYIHPADKYCLSSFILDSGLCKEYMASLHQTVGNFQMRKQNVH